MRLIVKGRPYTPLSASLKQLHSFCNVCGWRKGGIDSWNGSRCKCGHSALPLQLDAEWEESTGFFVNGAITEGDPMNSPHDILLGTGNEPCIPV